VNARFVTLLCSLVLCAALVVLGAIGTVPFVAEGPGPTYDTLGVVAGKTVVDVNGRPVAQTTGHLNMTTVSQEADLTLFGALGLWLSGRYAVIPHDEAFPPGKSDEQVQKENIQQFQDSESNAEVAALSYLKYPMKVVVGELVTGAPADGVLKPGDRLLKVGDATVRAAADVRNALQATTPGQQVTIGYQRGQDPPQTATITLGHNADRPQGFLGVSPTALPDVPFKVTITLADIGGPSAGLMFALAIVDKLQDGTLAGNTFVAGTGEIDTDGSVKPIGGINFKMTAAREAGATVFLVPADNCSEATRRAPDGLRLVKVGSLTDAVTALQTLKSGGSPAGC
jgi:PDZ domain-containing protein